MRQFESFAIRHVDNVLSVLDQTQLPDVEAWLVADSPDDMVCASLEHGLPGTAQWRGRATQSVAPASRGRPFPSAPVRFRSIRTDF